MHGQGKAKVSLTFGLYQGAELVRRETVSQDIVKVAKDPKIHLRVVDALAFRMHAVIEVARADEITLINLESGPGTIVNGQGVNKYKISEGDQIESGSTRLVLESVDAAAAVAAPAVPPPAPAPNPFAAPEPAAN